ncbi:hypothetical protein BKA61DRAFT_98974 [Leptodontidium sp. MPI-SDFR-AT-0119]|nr:hypothetical protein BKA61DRAFT_98974 [Leptodontidium sp. MPI-SDFR-AT-0119]
MNMQFGTSDETPRPGIAFSWTADHSESREDFEHRILRTALASDPDLFARSLSLFQAEWERRRIPQSPGVVSCVTSGESIQGGGLTESTQNSPSQNESGTQSRKHKLADGDLNDNENKNGEDGDEQHPNPKRPYVGPRFACHFHKMNPLVYDRKSTAGASEQAKWAKCGVYGSIKFKDLIADHLLKVHRIFDCTQCGESFDAMEAALNHAYLCPRLGQPQIQGPIREGISRMQVEEIKKIQGDRKNKLTERDKWMKVWKLLFPHKEEPKSPYFGEDDAPTPLPISTPEIESILRTFRNFVQADTRDGLMTIDHQTYARLEDRLRLAVVTTRSRAASGGMPTPSSSSMASSSPFSGNERNSHVGTPFSRNRDLSRVAMADAFPSSPNSSSRLNFGIAETPSDRVSIPPPSPHHPGVVNRRPSTSEPNSWTSAPLLDSSPVTGSQPSDAFAGFAQEHQALPSEIQQWHQNASPQTSDYMTENASSQKLYVQHQSNTSQIPSFSMSNQQPRPDALAQHVRRLQAEIQTLSQFVIPMQADPVDVRASMPGPQQHPMSSTHARPIVGSSVNAMNRLRHTDRRSSSPMRTQEASTPAHSVTPQQKHISNKSGKRNQIQQSHSSHVQQRQYKQPRTETHHQQYYQPVPSDAMHSLSHGTLDDNFYGIPATHGYSNPSNKSDWDEMLSMGETSAQCQQIGMPSDATPDDYMSNEYMTRLLDPDVPVEDTTDMNAESASDNAGGSQPFAN